MLTKRLSGLFALALLMLLVLAPAALAQGGSSSDATGGVLGMVCTCGCVIILLGVQIYIIYFLYTDATARGQRGEKRQPGGG